MTNVTEVKSINVNTVFNKKTVKENLNKPLFTIKGVAEKVITINTKYGEQQGAGGDFIAVNMLTGEVFTSQAAFLPKNFAKDLYAMLEKSENREVEFAATIKAIPSDKNNTGYAWVAEAPETQERANRRDRMMQEVLTTYAPKQLAAPEAAKTSGKKAA